MKKLLFIFLLVACSKVKTDLPLKFNTVFYSSSGRYSITINYSTKNLDPVNSIPSCTDDWTPQSVYFSCNMDEGTYNIQYYREPEPFNQPVVISDTFTVKKGCNIFCLNTAYNWQ